MGELRIMKLSEYAATEFPNHDLDVHVVQRDRVVGTDPALAPDTLVAHTVGSVSTGLLARRLEEIGVHDLAVVEARPPEPAIVADHHEDQDSMADLPDRRWATAALIGAVIGAVLLGLVGLLMSDEAAVPFITAGFGAALGAVIGSMSGGLGRHAGERAWSQPHAPGETVGIVAVFPADASELAQAVRVMEGVDVHDVRLVGADGAWRRPTA